jgi:hypothetical protein
VKPLAAVLQRDLASTDEKRQACAPPNRFYPGRLLEAAREAAVKKALMASMVATALSTHRSGPSLVSGRFKRITILRMTTRTIAISAK